MSMYKFLFLALFATASMAVEKYDSYFSETVKDLPELDSDIVYGGNIRRTMHLLSTSTKEKPNKVKIVFFGQSITRQNYARQIIETKLRRKYPHADLEVLNTAIGGYTAPKSVRTMFHTSFLTSLT